MTQNKNNTKINQTNHRYVPYKVGQIGLIFQIQFRRLPGNTHRYCIMTSVTNHRLTENSAFSEFLLFLVFISSRCLTLSRFARLFNRIPHTIRAVQLYYICRRYVTSISCLLFLVVQLPVVTNVEMRDNTHSRGAAGLHYPHGFKAKPLTTRYTRPTQYPDKHTSV